MIEFLVDTSVWIDYFRDVGDCNFIDTLIDKNAIVTNDVILTELIPFIAAKKEALLEALLREIKLYPLEIRWEELRSIQGAALKKGINKIGLPDLIIAQNALQNNATLLTGDKHFDLLKKKTNLPLNLYVW